MISCAPTSYTKAHQVQPIDLPRIYIIHFQIRAVATPKCTTPVCSWQTGVGRLMPSIDGTNYFLV